jgi:(p)ppGpp synthase/HD superfamily hydrolase
MVLADENANIMDVKTHADADSLESVLHLSVEIPDLPTLSTAITRLEQLPNVVSVKRKT